MQILLIDENRGEVDTILRHIGSPDRRVEHAASVKHASAVLARGYPDVIVVPWGMAHVQDFVRMVRAGQGAIRPWIVALLDRLSPPQEIPGLLLAGADDFLRRPLVAEELVARVDAPKRIRSWSGSGSASDSSDSDALARLQACAQLGEIVAPDLSEILGALSVAPGWCAELSQGVRCATIRMTLASQLSELRLSIVAPESSVHALTAATLGEPDAPAEAVDDLLRELSNVAGGAVKRAALKEDATLTTGLPVSEPLEDPARTHARTWVAKAADGAPVVGIVADVRKVENLRIPTAKLEEGMVLLRDIRNEAGALLACSGSRLTSTAAERLVRILGSHFVVEVSRAA